jgi:hypothetical protein
MSNQSEREYLSRSPLDDVIAQLMEHQNRLIKWSLAKDVGPYQADYYVDCSRLYRDCAEFLRRYKNPMVNPNDR